MTLTRIPGADVRRTRGEIAEFLTERERQPVFEFIVDVADIVPAFVEREAAAQDLQPQVVFLVDHQAHGFLWADPNAPGPVSIRVFSTDELPFDKKLPIERLHRLDIEIAELTG